MAAGTAAANQVWRRVHSGAMGDEAGCGGVPYRVASPRSPCLQERPPNASGCFSRHCPAQSSPRAFPPPSGAGAPFLMARLGGFLGPFVTAA
jgi:hypothetical protein